MGSDKKTDSWGWIGFKSAIILFGYILIIGISYSYGPPLFEWSLQEIPRQQKTITVGEEEMWKVLTNYISGGSVQILIFVIASAFHSRGHEAVVLGVNLSIQICVIFILKVGQTMPRPFWVNKEIKPSKCYYEFGNPSGHALMAVFFALYLFVRVEYPLPDMRLGKEPREGNTTRMGHFAKFIVFLILVIGAILVGYSRFILGVHSVDQVLYGSILGVWTLLMCLWLINPLVRHAVVNMQN